MKFFLKQDEDLGRECAGVLSRTRRLAVVAMIMTASKKAAGEGDKVRLMTEMKRAQVKMRTYKLRPADLPEGARPRYAGAPLMDG